MEHSILEDIVVIFALSTFVNFIFTKIKVPTIIGYLITGIIAGPYCLGIIKAPQSIELMAEMGIILLMFSIGLEFSLKHLFKIRRIVFLGGFIQLILTASITMFIARFYNLNWSSSLFVGFITALSSTAVVLKVLQDRSEITSNYGRTVIGILIFQDIILIPLLLFTPILGGNVEGLGLQFFWLGIKSVVIIAIVYVGNKWVMPWFLHVIAITKNHELFLMVILLICLSVALLTNKIGMSFAFGAFLAGLMISESEYSHNAFGNLIPFKDTFSSFFFVSIGMLLNLNFVVDNFQLVFTTVLVVIVVKTTIAGGTAFIMGHTFRGTVMAGLALSQVGEFSFILSKLGFNYKILSEFYYQLFLAVAITTMALTPFLIQWGRSLATILLKLPLPKLMVDGMFPLHQPPIEQLNKHVVIIGKDPRALNLAFMTKYINLPYISIVFDPATVRSMQIKGQSVLYGDATNEPVLHKAHIETAEVIVISVGNKIISMNITEKVRNLNKHAHIIVRTKEINDIEFLYKAGANQVIPEEFETSIDLFERMLTKLLIPRDKLNKAIAKIRDDNYGIFRQKADKQRFNLLKEIPDLETWAIKVEANSNIIGKTRNELKFRERFGVTLVAVKRNNNIYEHPEATLIFAKDDIAYFLGKTEKTVLVNELFVKNENEDDNL